MSDAIPPSSSSDDLLEWVEQALKLCRDPDVPQLAKSPLASTSLVEACLLPGEARTDRSLGLIMYALLRWAVETLRPLTGTHHWSAAQAPKWRFYNILFLFYFEGLSGAEVADKMDIGVDSFYSKKQGPRIQALRRVVAVLADELKTPACQEARWRCALNVRWEALSCNERLLCGLAALLRGPLPQELLYVRGATKTLPDFDAALSSLLDSGLLSMAKGSTLLTLQPSFRAIVAQRLTPETRRLAHAQAAHYYQSQESYLEAAYHFYHLGEREGRKQATCLLLDHWERLTRQHTLWELGDFLNLVGHMDAPDALWYQLKIRAGDLALETEGVDRAIKEYSAALGTKERMIKALAHYRLGEAQKRSEKWVEEGLANYEEALRLLEPIHPPPALLGEVLVDYSWFFIQERKDLRQASSLVRRARRVMSDEPVMWAKWYNAFAGLHAQLGHQEGALTYRLKALVAAKASGNRLLQSKILKNLGIDYIELAQEFDVALEYLTDALQLAREEGAKPLKGLCLKDIGGCHVWRWDQGSTSEPSDAPPELCEAARLDYHTAIGYYQQAYRIFEDTQHHNWRAGVCLDLTEAYAALGEGLTACRYFVWGCAIARAFGHRIYLIFAEKLLQRWPIIRVAGLIDSLNERERQILEFVARYRSITKAQHQSHHPSIAGATATRDLRSLVAKRLLIKVGKGPSTFYTFPPLDQGGA